MFLELSVFIFWIILITFIIIIILIITGKIQINNNLTNIASQTLYFNSVDNILTNGWMGINNVSSTIFQTQYIINNNCSLNNFNVITNQAPGPGAYYEFIIQKNGANTPMNVVILNTDKNGSYNTNTITFNKGDLLSIHTISIGSAPSTAAIASVNIINTL